MSATEAGTLPMSVRHRCTLMRSAHHCTHRNGRPRSKRCTYCGGSLMVEEGVWCAFVWVGDASYPRRDAVRTFRSESAAQKWCDERPRENVVVRWVYA